MLKPGDEGYVDPNTPPTSDPAGDGKKPADPSDPKSPAGDDDNKGDNKKPQTIPYDRFNDVVNERNTLQAKLDQIDADKKKREDDEALKRGEHEKVISERDATIADLTQKLADSGKLGETLKKISDSHLEGFKTTYGEEAYKQAIVLIGSEDPTVILEKLPTIESVFKDKKKDVPSGGSEQPGGGGTDGKLAEYKKRIEAGETLSGVERDEYLKLLFDKKD